MRDIINEQMKSALKNGQEIKLKTLRLINAAIKDRDINERTKGNDKVNDDQIIQILAKMIKQREESAKIYQEQNRPELAQQENEEIKVISEFMPEQMDDEQTKNVCQEVIKEVGAESLRDMGKCMNAIKQKYSGEIDISKASSIIKGELQ